MKAKLGLVALGCLMGLLTSEATIRLFAWATRERPWADRQQSSDPPAEEQALLNNLAEDGAFATLWDSNTGVLLPRKLFIQCPYPRVYRHRPNLTAISVSLPRFPRANMRLQVPDTPEVRRLLDKTPHRLIATAHFDQFGFRRGRSRLDWSTVRSGEGLVLMCGDSFTEGLWVQDDETFSTVVQGLLPHKLIVNAGVNGYSVYNMRGTVDDFAREAGIVPGTVVFNVFANDVHSFYYAVAGLADRPCSWREPFQLAPGMYRSLLVRFVFVRALHGCAWDLDPGSDPFEAGWKQLEADLRAARDACVAMRSRLVVSIVPVREQLRRTRRALASRQSYQGRIRSICGRLNIVCLDPLDMFRERPELEVYLENDPHFSPAGHELYGRFLAAELRRTAAAAQAP